MEHKNESMEPLVDTYEVPEMVELGEAALLTLGGDGCRIDGKDCQKIDELTEI